MKINVLSKKNSIAVAALVAISYCVVVPASVQAETACTFDRDLQLGVLGEDVRCLQQFLNATGYIITTSGGGAKGNETTEFKSLTQAAVIRWQKANGVSPASGYFGAKSRAAYQAALTGAVGTPTTPATPDTIAQVPSNAGLLAQVLELKASLAIAQSNKNTGATTVVESSEEAKSALLRMQETAELLRDAREEVADNEDAADYDDAVDSVTDAEADFLEGVLAYTDEEYADAEDYFDDTEGNIEDALDSVGSSSEKDEAEELIDDVNSAIDDADDEIDAADEAGEATSEAEDILDEAENRIEEAAVALDDGDYSEAIDLAEEADDLVDDAIDAIGDSGDDVSDTLDTAWDDLESARNSVKKALAKDVNVGDAEDLLDEAEDLLDDAETALDDDDLSEVEDLVDEALDLIEEALDEY